MNYVECKSNLASFSIWLTHLLYMNYVECKFGHKKIYILCLRALYELCGM